MPSLKRAITVCLPLLLAAPLGGPAAAADAAAGKALARTWCMSCHVVDKTGGGSDVAPGFAAIAADPKNTPDALRAFLVKPPHPMPNPQLSTREIDDIVAYIESLKRQ